MSSTDALRLPSALASAARSGELVVLAGAGVSAAPPTSLPGWYGLNARIVRALSRVVDDHRMRKDWTAGLCAAIEERRDSDGFPPDYQAELLHEHVGEDYFRALQAVDVEQRNAGHDGLARLAARGALKAIVTTNFDRLIELALEARGVEHEVAHDEASFARALESLLGPSGPSPLQVWKIHGSVEDPPSLIDTLKQRLRGRSRDLERAVAHLLESSHWLHAGFSAADLDTSDDYLSFLELAPRSPGLTYVQWPGSDRMTRGAQRLLHAYGERAVCVRAELGELFGALLRELGDDAAPEASAPAGVPTSEAVDAALHAWASDLPAAAAVNCLAVLAEANGQPDVAFQLLAKFHGDAAQRDRDTPAFERFRAQHGRLGAGQGLISVVEDLGTDRGMESVQDLLRLGKDARANAWAGLAWMWAGEMMKSGAAFERALPALDHPDASVEEQVDVWLALSEREYLHAGEISLPSYERLLVVAEGAGDLPRRAKVAALAALNLADTRPEEFEATVAAQIDPVLEQAQRLGDPGLTVFRTLAQGRFLARTARGPEAVTAFEEALAETRAAGRPPWTLFARIERAKALAIAGRDEEAATELNALSADIDRYQVWLPWWKEAIGLFQLWTGQLPESRTSFEEARDFALRMGLEAKAVRIAAEAPD